LLAGVVRAVAVVVARVPSEHCLQVPFVIDQHPVGARGPHGAHLPLGIAVRSWRLRRVMTIFTPSLAKISSKEAPAHYVLR
jgi:hypothetical protein